jgi:hypothetical protein
MSSDQSPSPPQSTPNNGRRRTSFVDMFGPRSAGAGNGQSSTASPRRPSITTLGLSTMPGAQNAGLGNHRSRGASISSANSGSVDESPFEDDSNSNSATSLPTSPFARRMSFGARALREVRNGPPAPGNANGRPSVSSSTAAASAKLTSPTTKGRGLSCSLQRHCRRIFFVPVSATVC